MFQRTPNFTMPAKNAPSTRTTSPTARRRAAEIRQAMRESRAGVIVAAPEHPALAVDDDERRARYDAAWETGTLYGMVAAFTDLLVDQDAQRDGRRVRPRPDPGDRRRPGGRRAPVATRLPVRHASGRASTPTTTRPTTATTSRSSTSARDPIVEITPTGIRTESTEYELDALVFATGFDAMTGPLLAHRHHGRDGLTLREKWAAGPRTYLGLADRRLPEPVHDHRPGQPVGAHQHDRVDRAARRLDRRLHRAPPRARRRTSIEADARRRGRVGRPRQRGRPTSRSSRRRTPGTSAPTCPGSRGCSCPTSAACARTRRHATSVAADGYRGFELTPAREPARDAG